jgi:hypothetical protein
LALQLPMIFWRFRWTSQTTKLASKNLNTR